MKQGMDLQQMAAFLEEQRQRKQDFVVDTREMTMLTTEEGGTTMTLPNGVDLDVARRTHRQIGQHLSVRADFYDRLHDGHPALHNNLINGLLREHNPGKRMVRTYTPKADGGSALGVARAFLSDSYRRIDNDVVAEAVLPVLGRLPGVQFHSQAVTDEQLYLKAVIPTVAYDLNEFIDPSKHVAVNDIVQAGVVVRNSEVGTSRLVVERLIYRLVCRNGMIRGTILGKTHLGGKIEAGEDLTIYRDETLKADDHALMMKLHDAVTAAVDDVAFRAIVKEFAEARDTTPMEQPVEAMKVLSQRVGLSEGEHNSVLQHLLTDGDLTKFGAVNAITRASQDVESYDRATELEQLGSTVLDISSKDWNAIALATA